jgi:hypothetical protein
METKGMVLIVKKKAVTMSLPIDKTIDVGRS